MQGLQQPKRTSAGQIRQAVTSLATLSIRSAVPSSDAIGQISGIITTLSQYLALPASPPVLSDHTQLSYCAVLLQHWLNPPATSKISAHNLGIVSILELVQHVLQRGSIWA